LNLISGAFVVAAVSITMCPASKPIEVITAAIVVATLDAL